MAPSTPVSRSGIATCCLLALVSSAIGGFLVPVFAGVLGVMFMAVAGVPDTLPRWLGVLFTAAVVSGCVAVALARSHLRLGWGDTGRCMLGPYVLAILAFATVAVATGLELFAPGVFEQSSPYLATAHYGVTAFSEGALGAMIVSLVLAARSRG